MKKLFMFLVVTGLAAFGTSCSSDDSSGDTGTGGKTREKQLVLSADKEKAIVGETVTFKTTVEGKVQTDVDIYVDGTKVANPFKTTKRGNLKVVAKKAGYMNSAEFDLTVRDQGEPENTKLILSVNTDKIKIGKSVTFTVMNAGKIVTDAEITLNGVKVSNPWTATASGTFTFVAKKAKYDNSNEVVVSVDEAQNPNNYYLYKNEKVYLEQAIFVYGGAQPFQGGVIDAYDLVLVKMDEDTGKIVENRVMGLVAFMRTDKNTQVYPSNGAITIAAYGAFEFMKNRNVINEVVSNATSIGLSGMTLVDAGKGVKVAEKGKVVFDFGLEKTTEKITGSFEGKIIVYTEQQAGRSTNSVNKKSLATIQLKK